MCRLSNTDELEAALTLPDAPLMLGTPYAGSPGHASIVLSKKPSPIPFFHKLICSMTEQISKQLLDSDCQNDEVKCVVGGWKLDVMHHAAVFELWQGSQVKLCLDCRQAGATGYQHQ